MLMSLTKVTCREYQTRKAPGTSGFGVRLALKAFQVVIVLGPAHMRHGVRLGQPAAQVNRFAPVATKRGCRSCWLCRSGMQEDRGIADRAPWHQNGPFGKKADRWQGRPTAGASLAIMSRRPRTNRFSLMYRCPFWRPLFFRSGLCQQPRLFCTSRCGSQSDRSPTP